MEVAKDTFQSVTPNDFNVFCNNLGLKNPGSSEPLSKNIVDLAPKNFVDASFTNVFKTNAVLKVGEIELSGMISWTKYVFLLTKLGFLHYFATGTVKKMKKTIF